MYLVNNDKLGVVFSQLSLSTSDVEVEDSLSESDASEVEEELEMEPEEEDLPLASTVRLLTHRKKVLERKQRQQHKLQVSRFYSQ